MAQAETSIPTRGEVFPDGSFIELIRPDDSAPLRLLLWSGGEELVGEVLTYRGRQYKPGIVHDTILRALKLPSRAASFGSLRDLLAEVSKLVDQYVRLPEKHTALVGRFVLATWLVDAMQSAPRIRIEGCDTFRARQLLLLLTCICRRSLQMTAVGPAAFCSLPSGFRFTLILDQTDISDKFSSFLDAAIRRDSPILKRGELLDLFGPQVIWRPDDRAWPPGSISIPCIPCGQKLPALDQATQAEIVENFQPKLLAFRFAYLAEARATNFDASKFALPLKELAVSFAAATPGSLICRRIFSGFCARKAMRWTPPIGWT